jgi:UDP-3-O-[3-hydroxymyristoyl] N-acetylglucosamine deacetylase
MGVGLHSGQPVTLMAQPAPAGSGIVFSRVDVPHSKPIPAHASKVSETRLGTSLQGEGASVATVEHLMAAFWGMGIDNAYVMLDGPEVPIMDGSSEPFIEMIKLAGLKTQNRARQILEITETVTVEIGSSKLEIAPYRGFCLDIAIDYNHPKIRSQSATYDFAECQFEEALSEARTFGFAHEVEALKQMGLARGGSLQNAIVLDETDILNAEGLRSEDEFVRHKALDCLGDLFLCGYRIQGRVTAVKPGHQINTTTAQALLQQPQKWNLLEAQDLSALPVAEMNSRIQVYA